MVIFRNYGKNYIYLDKKSTEFSNFAVGLLIRAIGHSLKIAYVDVSGKANRFFNFIENLSLDSSFVKTFKRMNLELFSFKSYDKISKVIIPLVEFGTLNRDSFFKNLNSYDLVIFDNIDLNIISSQELNNIMRMKLKIINFIFVFSNVKDFNSVKDSAEIITEFKYKKNESLTSNPKIVNIFGNGNGKSIFAFGLLIRNFIEKRIVKLIYFDKVDREIGEIYFFNALKKWSKFNSIYGEFDFVVNGVNKIKQFEEKINDGQKFIMNKKEAEEGLMLLKTSLKYDSVIVADELETVIEKGYLNIEDVLSLLKSIKGKLVITGSSETSCLMNISGKLVEIINEKK